jgi:hypothetical protein
MRKLIYLLCFVTPAYAQQIITLADYDPIQRVGDTLFVNNEGYDIVKVIKPFSYDSKKKRLAKYTCAVTYFVLPTDSIIYESELNGLRKDLLSSLMRSKDYEKNHTLLQYGKKEEFDLFQTIDITCKNCDWTFPITHSRTENGFEKKNWISQSNRVSFLLFPDLEKAMDSIPLLLYFGENQNYYFHFNHDGKEMDVKITVNDECSNYQVTKNPQFNITDLEEYLESLSWPIMKIASKVQPYNLGHNYDLREIMRMKVEEEIKNGFKNSIKVFDQRKDSLFAIVDSFNNKTILYDIHHAKEYQYSENQMGLSEIIDFNPSRKVDVNNDGWMDLVIDTIAGENTSIRYIRSDTVLSEYETIYSRVNTMSFQKDLGNFYFYGVRKDQNTQWAEIYYLKNEVRYDILSFTRHQLYKRKISRSFDLINWSNDDLETKKYVYYTFVLNNKKLIGNTANPKLGIERKKVLIKLIEFYLQHPEQLPQDFKVKK